MKLPPSITPPLHQDTVAITADKAADEKKYIRNPKKCLEV